MTRIVHESDLKKRGDMDALPHALRVALEDFDSTESLGPTAEAVIDAAQKWYLGAPESTQKPFATVHSFNDLGGTYDYVSPSNYRPPVGAKLYAYLTPPPALEGMDEREKLCQRITELEANCKVLQEAITERESELAEADRRAGASERQLASCRADVARFERVRDQMKAQWGADRNVSFDVVWQEALDAKAQLANGNAK